jgi:hypothetical protein
MTIMEFHESLQETDPHAYRVGNRLRITGPDGQTYLARLERVSDPSPTGRLPVVAAIIEPHRLRGSVLIVELPP